MDGRHFDELVMTLSAAGTRRRLLGRLSTLPFVGGLAVLLGADDAAAHGRRKRRKKRHKHGKGRHKDKKTKCQPESRSKTCAGKCGAVKNRCQKRVNCGSCACDPLCPVCEICDETTQSCVPDPSQQGTACGEPGQVCQADGTCACDASTCPTCTTCGAKGACQGCSGCCDGDVCVASCGACRVCDEDRQCASCPACCDDSGACQPGTSDAACGSSGACEICTGQNACQNHTCVCAPDCVGKICGPDGCGAQCEPGCSAIAACSGDGRSCPCTFDTCGATCCAADETCCGTVCVDRQSDPDHCGTCGNACRGSQTCQGGVCGVICGSAFCPAATEICVAGACQSCTVTCPSGTCDGTTLQLALDNGGTVYACPGRYTGTFTLKAEGVLIGAGQGDNPALDTMLDAQETGRVVRVLNPESGEPTAELRQLRITGGKVMTSGQSGVGVRHEGHRLMMFDCTVTENHAVFDNDAVESGGGIAVPGGRRLEMTGCTISDNSVTNGGFGYAFGGGIDNDGRVELTDCIIDGNKATTNGNGSGGGGLSNSGTSLLTRCQVTDNVARFAFESSAGGVACSFGAQFSVTLIDSFVWANTPRDCSGTVIGAGCGVAPPD